MKNSTLQLIAGAALLLGVTPNASYAVNAGCPNMSTHNCCYCNGAKSDAVPNFCVPTAVSCDAFCSLAKRGSGYESGACSAASPIVIVKVAIPHSAAKSPKKVKKHKTGMHKTGKKGHGASSTSTPGTPNHPAGKGQTS